MLRQTTLDVRQDFLFQLEISSQRDPSLVVATGPSSRSSEISPRDKRIIVTRHQLTGGRELGRRDSFKFLEHGDFDEITVSVRGHRYDCLPTNGL